ncbi:MAG: sigma-54 dependent transcriptional regulator [Pseudomonadota bacterium]
MAQILVVDDEERMRHLLSIMLERRGYKVTQAKDGQDALEKIRATPFDLVITDIKMPRLGGVELLKEIQSLDIPCPTVFITAFATVSSAVEIMRLGAVDYITKPFEEERILLMVERTLKLSKVMSENRDLRLEIKKLSDNQQIVYVSEKMKTVMDLAAKVGKSESAVMIYGESGTGKELLSRFIYSVSPRKKARFVPINCAAISPNLVEAELFGHEKGAYTGADRRVQGKFEYASGGTIFLDEIGDLPLDAQAKLLRALQEKKIQRVGGNEEIEVDVRVICATNQNLSELVSAGKFRQDLYFRINVFPISTPPLRERIEDVVPLARHFIGLLGEDADYKLTEGAIRMLREYRWPGNVRELANAMERGVILAQGQGVITADILSFLRPEPVTCATSSKFRLPPEGLMLEELEQDLVKQALAAYNNNQTAAAKILGLTRAKFRVLMKQVEK